MVEHTRAHERLEKAQPAGERYELTLGNLFIPETLRDQPQLPLVIHFHGGEWLPEVAAAKCGRGAVVAIQLGGGSAVYAKPFAEDEELFANLLSEAEDKSGVEFEPVLLSGWSAGYGAIREILQREEYFQRIAAVVLLDGLHTGYQTGKPGPLESELSTEPLAPFLAFAKLAVDGRKTMLITHSAVFPGTFASTTETADYLIRQLGARRRAVLKWGPVGMQQLSEARRGRFLLQGFAGNSAPDHVDHLHAADHFWEATWKLLSKEDSR